MRGKWILIVPLAILGLLVFAFIGGESVMLLWNWLLPPIFGWPKIAFWQALGMLALCRILFGGMRVGGGSGGMARRRIVDRVADRVGERWDRMTPEERERFRQRIRERCGFDPMSGEAKGS